MSSEAPRAGACWIKLERRKGFEPSALTLARSCSTTELSPHELAPDVALLARVSRFVCSPLQPRPFIPTVARG